MVLVKYINNNPTVTKTCQCGIKEKKLEALPFRVILSRANPDLNPLPFSPVIPLFQSAICYMSLNLCLHEGCLICSSVHVYTCVSGFVSWCYLKRSFHFIY